MISEILPSQGRLGIEQLDKLKTDWKLIEQETRKRAHEIATANKTYVDKRQRKYKTLSGGNPIFYEYEEIVVSLPVPDEVRGVHIDLLELDKELIEVHGVFEYHDYGQTENGQIMRGRAGKFSGAIYAQGGPYDLWGRYLSWENKFIYDPGQPKPLDIYRASMLEETDKSDSNSISSWKQDLETKKVILTTQKEDAEKEVKRMREERERCIAEINSFISGNPLPSTDSESGETKMWLGLDITIKKISKVEGSGKSRYVNTFQKRTVQVSGQTINLGAIKDAPTTGLMDLRGKLDQYFSDWNDEASN